MARSAARGAAALALLAVLAIATMLPVAPVASAQPTVVIRLPSVISEPIHVDGNGGKVVLIGRATINSSVTWSGIIIYITNASEVIVSTAIRGDIEAAGHIRVMSINNVNSLVIRRLVIDVDASLKGEDAGIGGLLVYSVGYLRAYYVRVSIDASAVNVTDYSYHYAYGADLRGFMLRANLIKASTTLRVTGEQNATDRPYMWTSALSLWAATPRSKVNSAYAFSKVIVRAFNENSTVQSPWIYSAGAEMNFDGSIGSLRAKTVVDTGASILGEYVNAYGVFIYFSSDSKIGSITASSVARSDASGGVNIRAYGVVVGWSSIAVNALAARGVKALVKGDLGEATVEVAGVRAFASNVKVNKLIVTGAYTPLDPMRTQAAAGIIAHDGTVFELTGSYKLIRSRVSPYYVSTNDSVVLFAKRPVALMGDLGGVNATLKITGARGVIETGDGDIVIRKTDKVVIVVSSARHLGAYKNTLTLADAQATIYVNGKMVYSGTIIYTHLSGCKVAGEVHIAGDMGRGTVRIGPWTPVPVGFASSLAT